MAWFFGQSLLFVVLAFLLGVLVGYLIWGRLFSGRRAESTVDPATAGSLTESPTQALAEPVPALAGVRAAAPEPSSTLDGDRGADPGAPSTSDGDVAVAEASPVADGEPAVEPSPVPEAEPDVEALPASEVALSGSDTQVLAVAGSSESATRVLPEPVDDSATQALPEPADDSATQALPTPADEAAPVDASHDDLRRVEGIGPAFERALLAAGIRTYQDLADADRATLQRAIAQAGLRFAPSLPTWSRQARLLADGDEAGFDDLTRRLIAGREISAPLDSAMDPGALTTDPAPDLAAAQEPDTASDTVPIADTEPTAHAEPAEDPEPTADAEPEPTEGPQPAADAKPDPEPTADPEPDPQPVTDADPTVVIEPVAATASRDNGAAPVPDDDLQRIEGIGPQMSRALHTAGIRTYRQLAASDTTAIRAAIEVAGLRFAPSLVTWARQAALLAEGDEAGLADLQRRLVAGRDVGRA